MYYYDLFIYSNIPKYNYLDNSKFKLYLKSMKRLNKSWLVIITLLLFVLFNFPIINIINNKFVFKYIPLSYVYFYSIWGIFIFVLRFIIVKITK